MGNQARRVKVGVVGCGVVASAYYLPFLMDHADLVAVCDLSPERTAACARLFGAAEQYQDYHEMLARADIEAVWILTGPGTHAAFTLAAVASGRHVLLQKPMATNMADANAIASAVRRAGVKALIEPSANTLLDPQYAQLRALVDRGVLGGPYWFSLVEHGPDHYHPSLGGNPYGLGAFYSADSGGMLFDYPYAPTQICTLLGSCKSVTGLAKISVPNRAIVPDARYNEYLAQVSDPHDANYWDVVTDLPRTWQVTMGAEDNVFSLYEMDSGAIGVFHVGRPFHPALPGAAGPGLAIYGTEGNLIMGGGYLASVISQHPDSLPHVDADGWWHLEAAGDRSRAKWPQPTPGGFNYYHESSRHLLDCIIQDRDPLPNVEWGRHITEMMTGAIAASRSGARYDLTSTLTGLR